MSSIPLSEQMGAMALVDELRHQQKQVQEHLDLPRRRAEIAEHIRTYYQNHNIVFDDNLIEQGVRQVFARRLLLEMPPVGAIDTWLINSLVRRSGVIKMLRTSAMVLLVIAFAVYKFTSPTVYSPAEVSEVSTDAAIVRDDRKKLFQEVDKQRGAVEALARRLAEQPDPQARPKRAAGYCSSRPRSTAWSASRLKAWTFPRASWTSLSASARSVKTLLPWPNGWTTAASTPWKNSS
ncbi:DUF6384 family protein [Pseudomonas sp. RA_105y_Pfl2_P56]|uniref:DUF6384 family protein n=1 Tax=Pseudomonas sp. RA_105y_Pfl2_P56 TaxID=3088701 RepID=UPI0030D76D06